MSARASLLAILIALFLLVLAACTPPAASPRPTPDETEAAETEAPETEEPEDDEESTLALDVGDCFNVVDEEEKTAETVDCDDEHEYEVYATVEIDEDELPDDEELEELTDECVGDVFEDFVGVEYAVSRWWLAPFVPSEDDWDDGHEVIVCALYDPEEDETEGSAEGSEVGQAEETEEPTDPPDDGEQPVFSVDYLLEHVPPDILEFCEPGDGNAVFVVVNCELPEGSGADTLSFYTIIIEAEGFSPEEQYDEMILRRGVTERDTGSCPVDLPAEAPYTIVGEDAGRFACVITEDEAAEIVWIDTRLGITAIATRADGDMEALHEWWLGPEAGPVP